MTDLILHYFKHMTDSIQNANSLNYNLMENLGEKLSTATQSSLLLIDRGGGISIYYNYAKNNNFKDILRVVEKKGRPFITEAVTKTINSITKEQKNITFEDIGVIVNGYTLYKCLVFPIYVGEIRDLTLIIYKELSEFSQEEIFLAEIFVAMTSLIMIGVKTSKQKIENRDKGALTAAVKKLSYSEKKAIRPFLKKLRDSNEEVIVVSKVASEVGISRSIAVSAMRKLESAGLIETKSLGVKGTFIKVLNDNLISELDR